MIRYASLLVLGNFFSRIVFASLTIAVAKLIEPGQYGAFSYAIALVSFASYFCELGLQNTYLREVSGRNSGWRDHTLASLYIRCLLFSLVCIVALLTLPILVASTEPRRCVELMFVPGVLGLMLTSWISGVLLSRSDARGLCAVKIKAALAQLVCISIGIFVPIHSIGRSEIIALSYGLGLMIGGLFGFRSVPLSSLRISARRLKHFGRRLITGINAYLFSGFLYMLAPSLGVLILERSASLAVVGTFALATRVPQFLYTIPGSVGQAFYPKLFQATREKQWVEWSDLLFRESLFLLATGFVLSMTVLISAPLIVKVLGHKQNPGYQLTLNAAVHIGALVILMQSMSTSLGHALETAGRAQLRTIGQAVSLCAGGAMFYVLGSRFGVQGAMAAAAATEFALLVVWFLLLIICVKEADISRLFLPSFAALGCATVTGVVIWIV